MNTNEDRLQSALNDRADTMTGRSIDVGAAQQRAGRIRRRRRVVAASALAAVLAVGTPFAVQSWQNRGDDRGLAPVAPTGTESTNSAPVTPTGEKSTPVTPVAPDRGTDLDLVNLPLGGTTELAWLDDSQTQPVLHVPGQDPRTLPDPGDVVVAFALREDGGVVLATEKSEVVVYDDQGAELLREPSQMGLAVSADGVTVAWARRVAGESSQIRVLNGTDTTPQDWNDPQQMDGAPVAVEVSNGECQDPTPDNPGCRIAVSVDGQPSWVEGVGEPSPIEYLEEGQEPRFSYVSDAAGSGAGESPILGLGNDENGCGIVYRSDPADPGEPLQGADCGRDYVTLSPRQDKAAVSKLDQGPGPASVVGMYDLAADTMVWQRGSSTEEQATVRIPHWEDQNHMVSPVHQDGSWFLVRFDQEGGAVRVSENVPGTWARQTVVLQTRD